MIGSLIIGVLNVLFRIEDRLEQRRRQQEEEIRRSREALRKELELVPD